MNIDTLDDSIQRLEIDCELPVGFTTQIAHESDWSFVIKLHSILEAATSQLLTRTFARDELSDIFSNLEMSNVKIGKLAFIKTLALLPKEHCDFIRLLSELRNQLVHRITNVEIDLRKHFLIQRENRNASERKKFADKWAFALHDTISNHPPVSRYIVSIKISGSEELLPREKCFFEDPKKCILFSALAVLDAISMNCRYGEHIWTFLMQSDDRAAFLKRAEDVFTKAKVGDPRFPFEIKERLERSNPGLRIRLDIDGQPILESLAAAFYTNYRRKTAELDAL